MKVLRRIVLAVLVLAIVGGVILYLNLNRIVRATIERQSEQSLNLQTDLAGARLSLLGGKLSLSDLGIGSPKGFEAPRMLTLGGASVAVEYGKLRDDPVRIAQITIDRPTLVIEQAGGKFNFKAAMDQMPQQPEPPPDGKRDEGEPLRLIIDEMKVNDATVVLRPGLPGLAQQEIRVPVPSLTLRNVGSGEGAQNGAAIRDVVMELITALAAKASETGGLPGDLKNALETNVRAVAAQLGEEMKKHLEQISGQLDKRLPGLGGAATQEAGKAIERGLGGLLKSRSKDDNATPSE